MQVNDASCHEEDGAVSVLYSENNGFGTFEGMCCTVIRYLVASYV
jgi:hypothetical protein